MLEVQRRIPVFKEFGQANAEGQKRGCSFRKPPQHEGLRAAPTAPLGAEAAVALGEGWEASACGPLAAASPRVVSGLNVQQVANLWCLTSRISLPWAGRQPWRDPWASSYGAALRALLPLSTRPGPTQSHGAEAGCAHSPASLQRPQPSKRPCPASSITASLPSPAWKRAQLHLNAFT